MMEVMKDFVKRIIRFVLVSSLYVVMVSFLIWRFMFFFCKGVYFCLMYRFIKFFKCVGLVFSIVVFEIRLVGLCGVLFYLGVLMGIGISL